MTNKALKGNGRVHEGTDNVPGTIKGTDKICEFIEEVVGKCADNSGYVFAPEVITRLSSLKQEDRLAFETLRVRLRSGLSMATSRKCTIPSLIWLALVPLTLCYSPPRCQ